MKNKSTSEPRRLGSMRGADKGSLLSRVSEPPEKLDSDIYLQQDVDDVREAGETTPVAILIKFPVGGAGPNIPFAKISS
jgi:hypothetical protein